jgi:hypothetical protein
VLYVTETSAPAFNAGALALVVMQVFATTVLYEKRMGEADVHSVRLISRLSVLSPLEYSSDIAKSSFVEKQSKLYSTETLNDSSSTRLVFHVVQIPPMNQWVLHLAPPL